MQNNFRLVQLFLNLHDTICLLRVLILFDVFFELGESECGVGVCEGGAGVAGEEFIDDFGEELMGDERGVVRVADYNTCDAFGAAIGVECVG